MEPVSIREHLGALMSNIQFDPKISLGNILTLLGGALTLLIVAVTLYVESGTMKTQLAETRKEQAQIVKGVSRLEAQMEVLLGGRKHAGSFVTSE